MPIRRRAWLTREGWYYLSVLAFVIGGAVLRSVNLLVILAGAMIAPLLFNWRLVMASLTGLQVRRTFVSPAMAGEPVTFQIDVENARWWMSSWLVTVEDWLERQESSSRSERASSGRPQPARGRARDEGRRGAAHTRLPAATLLPHVPAGGCAVGTYRVTLFRRGRYRIGPLRISTRFPLGLVVGQVTLPEYGELVVAPRLGRLLPAWISLLEAELAGDERRHPQRGLSEGDYYGLRPWQSGDSLRWIHWRTTAKLARPIVRQYERRKSRDVALVLDPWLPERAGEHEEGAVEMAISLMATAINDIARRGDSRLTVVVGDPEATCASGPASAVFCEEMLMRLAELVPAADVRLSEALRRAVDAAPRGARMIVISPRGCDDASLADAVELGMDADDCCWINTSRDELASLFVIE